MKQSSWLELWCRARRTVIYLCAKRTEWRLYPTKKMEQFYTSLTESWLCSSSMGKKVQKWQFRKITNRKINENRGKGLDNEFLRVSSILINAKQPLSSRCRVVNWLMAPTASSTASIFHPFRLCLMKWKKETKNSWTLETLGAKKAIQQRHSDKELAISRGLSGPM